MSARRMRGDGRAESVMENYMLHLGDCLDYMQTLDAGSVDLIYSDFVYDDLDFRWMAECTRLLRETGSIYVQADFRSVAQAKLALDSCGLLFQNWIVWCYKAYPQRQRRYQRKHDDILFYTKTDTYTWNNPEQPPSALALDKFQIDKDGSIINLTPSMRARGGKHYIRDVVCRDWWDDIPVPSGFSPWDTGLKVHKWQKPIKLLNRIINASSNPGDTVFDPFMGSGTTGVACIKLGRRFVGCEINSDYYAIAEKRIREAASQMIILL